MYKLGEGMKLKYQATLLTIGIMFLLIGCANPNYRKGRSLVKKGQYTSAIEQLKLAENEERRNWKIKRELGIALYRNNEFDKAIKKLKESLRIQARNGRTLLYLGLSYESKQMFPAAINVYNLYITLSFLDPLKKELQARIRDIHLKELQQEVRNNLSDFEKGNRKPLEPNTVAVIYFRNISKWQDIDPVSKGICEIMATDLSKVKSLRLVERAKLQILLDELKVPASEFIDSSYSLRTGQILGASRLVSGGIERLNETELQMNAGVVVTETGQIQGDGALARGTISELLRMEKILIFDLIDDMGIKLTQAENDAIRPLPTKNALAFISFSRGLDFEDKGLLENARAEYAKAVELDPGFSIARRKLNLISIKRLSISTIEKLASYEERLASTEPTLLDAGAKLGLDLGVDNHEVTSRGPITGFGTIRVSGDLPVNN